LTKPSGDYIYRLTGASHVLETLIDTLGRDQGIGRSNGGNNVLSDTHRKLIGDSRNIKFFRTDKGSLEDPSLIFRAVFIHGTVLVSWLSPFTRFFFFFPLDLRSVQDAVRGLAGNSCDRAHRHSFCRSHSFEGAFVTSRLERNDDTSLSHEAFGTSIDDDLIANLVWIRSTCCKFRNKTVDLLVDPTTSLNVVQTVQDDVEG